MVGKESRFYDFTISHKLLDTCFLLLLGLGYLMALAHLYVTHENLDGKPGLSITDVADGYYGNRSGTALETSLRGSMAGKIKPEDRNTVVAWLEEGASEAKYDTDIKPIMEKSCLRCHSATANKFLPDFSTYEGLYKYAEVDTGMSIATLLKLSHIHLFGITLLLFTLGSIFIHTELNVWFKRILMVAPMASMFVDIMAWFLTKWDPVYAWVVVIAGGVLGFSIGLQIVISLYQLWFLKRPAA